jgi:NAD+ synthase (glutamine-hydrolysing)
MTNKLRIELAQLNLTVGDIDGNLQKLIHAAIAARDERHADIIVFPELCITSYPPEDLLLRPAFIAAAQKALEKFIAAVTGIYCLVGHPHADKHRLFNACSLIYNGQILGHYKKKYLPNYGVFDEYRYFTPGNEYCVVDIKGVPVGLVICEDLWRLKPITETVKRGAKIILSPNASPFEADKHERRVAILSKQAKKMQTSIIYVNHVGGQDELIFDGGSMVIDTKGELCQLAKFFAEDIITVDIDLEKNINIPCAPITLPPVEERIYRALVLSMQEYFRKNHLTGALVGVSGGIDSALTLAIAVDALGKDRVKAIMMPSRHTSTLSMEQAIAVTNNLDVEAMTISIEPMYENFLTTFAAGYPEEKLGITAQNVQARLRCLTLMALSNQSGFLVLSTSNRSELAVGYSTLYGDMSGGFAVLKDIPKTLIYRLAKYRNQKSAVIPQITIDREPTAELAPNQKDEDTLPPYAILDQILEAYLNHSKSAADIIADGFDKETVEKVIAFIRKNEYKRYQAPLGPHINHKSFGKDWRYPLTDGFKG